MKDILNIMSTYLKIKIKCMQEEIQTLKMQFQEMSNPIITNDYLNKFYQQQPTLKGGYCGVLCASPLSYRDFVAFMYK